MKRDLLASAEPTLGAWRIASSENACLYVKLVEPIAGALLL